MRPLYQYEDQSPPRKFVRPPGLPAVLAAEGYEAFGPTFVQVVRLDRPPPQVTAADLSAFHVAAVRQLSDDVGEEAAEATVNSWIASPPPVSAPSIRGRTVIPPSRISSRVLVDMCRLLSEW